MSPAAIVGAIAVGLSLGILGSGGSILTVPVLRTLVGHEFKLVVAESLGIVGVIAAVGAVPYGLAKQIEVRAALLFGTASAIGAWLGSSVAHLDGVSTVQPAVFIVTMLAASVKMIRGRKATAGDEPHDLLAIPVGLGVGFLTGFVGVGGGFLIVPALVVLLRVPMKRAVGTSLCLVATSAFTGFFSHLRELEGTEHQVDWKLFWIFSGIGAVGSLVGSRISKRIPQASLRRAFGVLLIGVAGWLAYTEFFSGPA